MPMLDSYLFFNGNCAEAMRFYQQTIGGELTAMMKYGDSPDAAQNPPGSAERIIHASLVIDGRNLMASDHPAGESKAMSGFALSLFYDTPAEARRVFDALSAGGSITMPMSETFWAQAFGMFTDKFGTSWMVSGGSRQP
jgi:PhnB protein